MSVNFSWPIFGHNKQINFLQNTLKQGNLANAYLFYGASGLGKKMIAKYFVQSLFCTENTKPCQTCSACQKMNKGLQQNFLYLSALKTKDDNGEIQVMQVRHFLSSLSLTSFDGGYKLAVIYAVDKLNIFSLNALLKVIEEPPKNTTIILIADQINNLPATVISRCQLLKFQPLNKVDMLAWLETFSLAEIDKQTILNLSFGKPGLALEYIEDNLVNFKKDCQFLLKILNDNTFVAWQDLEHWFNILKKENPQAKVYELSQITVRYLDLWQLLLRDILWYKLNRSVLNVLFLDNISKISQKYSVAKILNNLLRLNQIRRQLKNNVTPQLVWENLLLDLKI